MSFPYHQPHEPGPAPPPIPCARCGQRVPAGQACSGLCVAGFYCGACWVEWAFPEDQRRIASAAGACP